jgi:hypothetical protein
MDFNECRHNICVCGGRISVLLHAIDFQVDEIKSLKSIVFLYRIENDLEKFFLKVFIHDVPVLQRYSFFGYC